MLRLLLALVLAAPQNRYYYELHIYHCKTPAQVQAMSAFLERAYLPALHRAGIPAVGVFTPVTEDTADRRIYVLLPFPSFESREQWKDMDIETTWDNAPYIRMESILMRAFEDMPAPAVPNLQAPKSDRVYELRSYESPTGTYHENKVRMFNEGGEVALFQRLGFNAVFYADVLEGSHMPNLMYMTTFNSKADRDQHWAAFGNDPEWKRLVALPEYQHNVSKADITFLKPEAYSDF
jgi:hypothetical protein